MCLYAIGQVRYNPQCRCSLRFCSRMNENVIRTHLREMRTYKKLALIFILHLFVILCFSALVGCADDKDAAEGWTLFFILDFPFGFLAYPLSYWIDPLISPDNFFLRCVMLPVILFQMFGTMNWYCWTLLMTTKNKGFY